MPSAYYKMLTTYLPSIVFFGLSFLCLPFLTEGYFFLLDGGLFSTPAISFSFLQFFDQSLFYFLGLFKLLSFVFPTWILQRCLYIGMLFLLGFIGYKLIERHTKIGGYFAGILMMFNPFVYARFLDGQITVIAGIVFLLISWHFLLLWMREMDGVSGRWAAVFSGIAIMWTQHAIFFVFVGLLIFLGLLFIQTKNFKKIGKYFLIFT